MRLAAYGDVLMATPLLSALRQAYPHAHITWIVERNQADTIIANPVVDEILLWEGRFWKRLIRRGLLPLWLFAALKFRNDLLRRKYDIFISLQPEEWPALTRAVKAPVRIGIFDTFRRFNRAKSTSKHVRLFTHWFAESELPLHRTRQYLLCLEALGLSTDVPLKMTLGYTEGDRLAAQRYLAENGASTSTKLIVIAPQTTWPSRCWAEERFVEIGDRLSKSEFTVLLIGSPKERDVLTRVAAKMSASPLTSIGNLTFRQTSAIIASAALVLSGDTGPMHAAAAVGTPYVALFGSTSKDWYGPLAGRGVALSHPVPCGPCDQKKCPIQGSGHLRCLDLITVDEAFQSCLKYLTTSHNDLTGQ